MIHLPHLASRLFGTPLLVHRAKLDVILAVLGPRLGLTDADSGRLSFATRLPPPLAFPPDDLKSITDLPMVD